MVLGRVVRSVASSSSRMAHFRRDERAESEEGTELASQAVGFCSRRTFPNLTIAVSRNLTQRPVLSPRTSTYLRIFCCTMSLCWHAFGLSYKEITGENERMSSRSKKHRTNPHILLSSFAADFRASNACLSGCIKREMRTLVCCFHGARV